MEVTDNLRIIKGLDELESYRENWLGCLRAKASSQSPNQRAPSPRAGARRHCQKKRKASQREKEEEGRWEGEGVSALQPKGHVGTHDLFAGNGHIIVAGATHARTHAHRYPKVATPADNL